MPTNSRYNKYPEVHGQVRLIDEFMRPKRRRLLRVLLAESWDRWTRYERTWKRFRKSRWK